MLGRSVSALLLATIAATCVSAQIGVLPGNTTVTAPAASMDLRFGFLAEPRALFVHATFAAHDNRQVGFTEFRVEFNATSWLVFQFARGPSRVCQFSGIVSVNETTGEVGEVQTVADPVMEVLDAVPILPNASAQEVRFVLFPFSVDVAAPRLNVSAGRMADPNSCAYNALPSVFVDVAVPMFAPFAADAAMAMASSGCYYGIPNTQSPSCASCFSNFGPAGLCNSRLTPAPPTPAPPPPTTTPAPNTTTMPVNASTTAAETSMAPQQTTTGASGDSTPAATTTVAPGTPVRVRMVTLTVARDPDAFVSETFRQAVASSVGTSAERVVVYSVRQGSTVVKFYFTDAAGTQSATALTDAFIATGTTSPAFASQFTLVGQPTVEEEDVYPNGQTTAAPLTDGGDDDSGLSTGQIIVLVVLVVVVIAVVIAGCVYVMRKKDKARGAPQPGNAYGQEMDAAAQH